MPRATSLHNQQIEQPIQSQLPELPDLQESDEFTGHQSRLPGNGDLPDDVGQDADEADAEVGGRQVLDEEVHSGMIEAHELGRFLSLWHQF